MEIPLEYARPTPGKDRVLYIPEMHFVGKAMLISANGNIRINGINGGCNGYYEAETSSVIIRGKHEIKPVTILWLDTDKMPPDLKSEWYL